MHTVVHSSTKRSMLRVLARRSSRASALQLCLPAFAPRLRSSSISFTPAPVPAAGYDAACELVQLAKANADTLASAQQLARAGDLFHDACAGGDGRACTRLGRWHVFGVGGRPLDARTAWGLLHRGWQLSQEQEQHVEAAAEAAYWLGHICANKLETEQGAIDRAAKSAVHSTAPLPLPSPDTGFSAEAEASRRVAAAAVVEEIKAARKAAHAKRRARLASAAPGGTTASGSGTASGAVVSAPVTLPPSLPDNTAAKQWWLLAAQLESADAQVALGNLCLQQPESSPAVLEEASAWYELAATGTQPHPDALFNLGTLLYDRAAAAPAGSAERSACASRSLCLFQRAAEADTSAMYWLGQAMLMGDDVIGVPVDTKSALKLLTQAADLGHGAAQFNLHLFYRSGEFKSSELSEQYLLRSEQSGHADAQYEMGQRCLGHAQEQEQDIGCDATAGHVHSSTCGHAHTHTQCHAHHADLDVGGASASSASASSSSAPTLVEVCAGAAVPLASSLYARALSFFTQAGEQGHADALGAAGAMHYHGLGTAVDKPRALQLYERGAELGSVDSLRNVAAMLGTGDGVPENTGAAKYIMEHLIAPAQPAPAPAHLK